MLIIFDLDDTLIDTSGSVMPFKMRECLKKLISAGMEVPSFEESYRELLALNNASFSSKEALARWILQMGFPLERAHSAFSELTAPLPTHFSIPTTPQAKEILAHFRPFCVLALVTGGSPPFQFEKMEKASLDRSIFSKIAIPEDSVKKPMYQALIQEFSIPTHEIWVCGDRVEVDLKPARELGMKTVHMQWGRGKWQSADWIDFSISSLSQLKEIVR